MGQKIKLQTLVQIFTKYWWIYTFYISQGSVASVVVCLVTTLLQIFHRMHQWKKCLKIGQ